MALAIATQICYLLLDNKTYEQKIKAQQRTQTQIDNYNKELT